MHFGKVSLSVLGPLPSPGQLVQKKKKGWHGANGWKTPTVSCIHPFSFDCVYLFCTVFMCLLIAWRFFLIAKLPWLRLLSLISHFLFSLVLAYLYHSHFVHDCDFTLPACALTPALTSVIPGLPSVSFTHSFHFHRRVHYQVPLKLFHIPDDASWETNWTLGLAGFLCESVLQRKQCKKAEIASGWESALTKIWRKVG